MPSRARERLQQDRHQVGEQDDAEQRVAEPRAAGEVGGPVARVHVADGHQVARAGEREQLAPEPRVGGIGTVPWTSGRLFPLGRGATGEVYNTRDSGFGVRDWGLGIGDSGPRAFGSDPNAGWTIALGSRPQCEEAGIGPIPPCPQ